jgi:protein disulfide-isomerase A6
MKNVLTWYLLLLVVLFCASVFREGFESSPATLFKDLANKTVFLLVYMEGCVHCKNLKPIWDKVASKYSDKMVAVDASDSSNEATMALVKKLNITGYPAMFEMKNGVVVQPYEGGRTEKDLTDFVNSMQ